MDLELDGRRAVVAAASSGLGFAAARALTREGASVAICGRNLERLRHAADEIGAVAVPMDVSTSEGAAAFVEATREELGGVDILVTNAGGPPPGSFATTSTELYAPALEANLLSVVAMCTAAVPGMREAGWGRIVAISSIAVRQPIPNLILSNTARAGAAGFLKTLALEVAGDGVTVNTLLPAYHDTSRVRSVHGEDVEHLSRELPMRRIGAPADFGDIVAFLSSRSAGFVTGTAIPVDGGAHTGLL